jgi:transposase
MNTVKYIGMDVHLATISMAVLDGKGKLIMEVTIATQAGALLDCIRGLSGTRQVTFEEGTSAHWLYTLLEPQVAKAVVCDPRQNPRRRGEKKSDRLDARKLAEGLRLGTLKPVYHGNSLGPALKELARSYRTLVSDTTRVMSRLKALYRARGIRCAGTRVYSPRFRDQWLEPLREPGARARADLLYKQLDLLLPLRQEARAAMLAESRKHPAQKILCSIPALGPVPVALLLALLQTPYRFRGKRQLWTYAGLALVTRTSADYQRVDGQVTRARKPALVLGLNANHNHTLKGLFKDAAASALAHPGPFKDFYPRE